MFHTKPSISICGSRRARLIRGTLSTVLLILLTLFPSACSRDTLPTSAEPANLGQNQDKDLDTFSNADSPEQIAALDILSRTSYLKSTHYAPDRDLSRPAEGVFVLEKLSPEAYPLSAGMIVMGPAVGPPREIDSVARFGNKYFIETHRAPWDLVSEAGPLRIRIPMGRQAGQNGPISWGETMLGDVPDGIVLKDAPDAASSLQPADLPNPFDWLGLDFKDVALCAGGGGSNFCVGLNPEILDGTCDLDGHFDLVVDWKNWDEFCEYIGPWPWDVECDFNPLKMAVLTAGFSADLGLLVQLEGSATVSPSDPPELFTLLEIPLSRTIKIGNLDAGLAIKIDLYAKAGIQEVKIQTGFDLHTGVDLVVGWDHGNDVGSGLDPSFTFDPVFNLIDPGEGFVQLGIKPAVVFKLEVIEDLANLEMSVGVANYLQFDIGPDDSATDCSNWHSGIAAKSDLQAQFKIQLSELPDINLNWGNNLAETRLRDDWGTGDLQVITRTIGMDQDPNGYRIWAKRGDPEADPAWDEEKTILLGANSNHVWAGGNCRELNPEYFDPGGILDCDLAATQHELQIDGIMWNCALQGEADRLICLHAGEQVSEKFEVVCVSAFGFLGGEVQAAIQDGSIRNQGIAQSILAKLSAAEKKRDQGQFKTAINVLSALDKYLEVTAGNQIDEAFARHMQGRVHDIMNLFVYPSTVTLDQYSEY